MGGVKLPEPTPNYFPAVWPLVIADMQERDRIGRERYGTPLQPFNGRDALADAYAECLDMAVYLKQAMLERAAAGGRKGSRVMIEINEGERQRLANLVKRRYDGPRYETDPMDITLIADLLQRVIRELEA